MSRLTEYHCGIAVIKDKNRLSEAMAKLAKYEDLEEQGLLLELPCKVGDVVYTTSSYLDCDEDECVNIDFCQCEEDILCEHLIRKNFVKETKFQIQMLALFGKTVFLTKEEAEEALKRME